MSEHIVDEISAEDRERRNQEYEDSINKAYENVGTDIKIGVAQKMISDCEECIGYLELFKFVFSDKPITVELLQERIKILKHSIYSLTKGN